MLALFAFTVTSRNQTYLILLTSSLFLLTGVNHNPNHSNLHNATGHYIVK